MIFNSLIAVIIIGLSNLNIDRVGKRSFAWFVDDHQYL